MRGMACRDDLFPDCLQAEYQTVLPAAGAILTTEKKIQEMIMNKPVTIYYLQMTEPKSLCPSSPKIEIDIRECTIRQYQYNKFLYQFIGEKWLWADKLSWTDEEWQAYVASDSLRTWVAYKDAAIAGYFELLREGDEVEIMYFGLAEQFIGKGCGGYLLTEAIRKAWSWEGARRVWVHTCTLDHPSALKNYQARGMQIYKEEIDS